ncbi:DUF4326 domain-containing protein [Subtercola endophyticus]|uniref:DUF4326 domain-containing protein n=1 Tax=Subtercola endophyticus TaxID=2895559 RepID=UPI001E6209B9|nr:DUF4326 domain-containing protein [Subtercola endophyticus]UFS59491.1 DUF4326 domain-containing protein [Subtercola endophyticus]
MTDETPKRIQLSRKKGWRKPEGAISVSRPGQFGNPFAIGVRVPVWWRGRDRIQRGNIETETNEQAVAYFRDWMNGVVDVDDWPRPYLPLIRGRDLCCWCPADQPCHADVLLELANPSPLVERVKEKQLMSPVSGVSVKISVSPVNGDHP